MENYEMNNEVVDEVENEEEAEELTPVPTAGAVGVIGLAVVGLGTLIVGGYKLTKNKIIPAAKAAVAELKAKKAKAEVEAPKDDKEDVA